jgi:hypothetical protein
MDEPLSGASHSCVSHRMPRIGVHSIGVPLMVCLSWRASHRGAFHRVPLIGVPPIGVPLIGVPLIGVSLIGMYSMGVHSMARLSWGCLS